MDYTDQQIEDGIAALMDRGVNKAAALRTVLHMIHANLASLVIPAGAHFLFGAGAPAAAKGADGDVYDNILTGDRYAKDAGAWAFQYRAKGDAGYTPRKGVDYTDGVTPRKGVDYRDGTDGKSAYEVWLGAGNTGSVAVFLNSLRGSATATDGKDGTIYHQENYDPTPADGNDGDIWQTSVTIATERRYKKVAGAWRLFYDNTGVVTPITPPNTAPSVLIQVAGTSAAPKFTATAADADGVKSIFVKVYDGASGQLVQTFGPSAPGDTSYITTWATASAGSYVAKAVATDMKDLSATSDGVAFTVAAAPTVPTITSFAPASGAVGSTVTVTGTNLAGITSATIGGAAVATIASNTAISVTLTVPVGAATGQPLTLTTAGGTATSVGNFTVQPAGGAGAGLHVGANDALVIFINGQSNAQGNAEGSESLFSPMAEFSPNVSQAFSTVNILNVTNDVFEPMQVGVNTRSTADNTYPQGYTFGATVNGTWDNGNPNNKYNIVGVGPEYGLADAWKSLGSTVPIYLIKFCEGGTSINRWLKSANDLYPKFLAHKEAAFAGLTAAGKNIRVLGFLRNQGEADATMSVSDYQGKLTQLYADLASDGFITAETKIIECGTPTTNDTGTPVSYGAETTAKQNFVAVDPTKRFFLDPAPGGALSVALEHDEIHWNLATQYWMGFVRVANLLFGTNLTLPATISVPAPSISFDSSTSLVTVTPPTGAWPQKEFYYSINGGPDKRLTTSFSFPIPGGVSVASGQLRVWSRAVPGRARSSSAINNATWVGVATSNIISWSTVNGRFTSTDGSGNMTRLFRSGGNNAWDAYAPATVKINVPAGGVTGEIARITLPNIKATQGAIVLGISTSATIATKNDLFCGIYGDNGNVALMVPSPGNPDNLVVSSPYDSAGNSGVMELVINTDSIVLLRNGTVFGQFSGGIFGAGKAYYVHGLTFGFAGWLAGQEASQIFAATLGGSTLAAAF